MDNRLYHIIDPKRDFLKKLVEELEKEYDSYIDEDDFDAIVLLKAIKNLDL